jgi:hypothetical protein
MSLNNHNATSQGNITVTIFSDMALINHNDSSQGNITVTISSAMPLINHNASSQGNNTFIIAMVRPPINHNAMATTDHYIYTGEGYNMLSGKTQYYNAVRKESFKTINSVTFCAGTKGRHL